MAGAGSGPRDARRPHAALSAGADARTQGEQGSEQRQKQRRCLYKPGMTMFALVDCNNFYASCERAFQPRLEGRPVVVLSNNDGCVIARSNEAKKLGIGMGVPYFKVRPLIELHQVAVRSSNYELYGDMS